MVILTTLDVKETKKVVNIAVVFLMQSAQALCLATTCTANDDVRYGHGHLQPILAGSELEMFGKRDITTGTNFEELPVIVLQMRPELGSQNNSDSCSDTTLVHVTHCMCTHTHMKLYATLQTWSCGLVCQGALAVQRS